MDDDHNQKGQDEMEDGPDTDELGIKLQPPHDTRPTIEPKKLRKRELGFIPIPKSKRLDPNLKVQEQFVFTWKINLILAGAAVSLARRMIIDADMKTVSVSNLYYSQACLVLHDLIVVLAHK